MGEEVGRASKMVQVVMVVGLGEGIVEKGEGVNPNDSRHLYRLTIAATIPLSYVLSYTRARVDTDICTKIALTHLETVCTRAHARVKGKGSYHGTI